jgi:hypothetical protein
MLVKRISKTLEIIEAAKKQASIAVNEAADEAEEVAKRLVPVDQGNLKSTIRVEDGKESGEKILTAGGESDSGVFVDYETLVEFGSDHDGYSIPAQPFFRPGVDAGRRKLKSGMKFEEK